jgi:radical SAM superfamily enzyme YgiQ (UPF0313 family)
MQVALITPTPEDISAFGVRALSAYLKRAGYSVRIIFLPGSHKRFTPRGDFVYVYTQNLLEEVCELCKDSCLIGISFMTYFFDRAVQLTQALKRRHDIPVIWGGIHPTLRAEEALEYADMVCIGEGEDALLELTEKIEKGQDYSDVKNVWVKRNGKVIKNPLRPLIKDLDTLPFIDFDLDEHYCYDHVKDSVREIDDLFLEELLQLRPDLKGNFQICYRTMTDRGCPHRCTYCSISVQKELYQGQSFFRKRSVENVVKELGQIKKRFPFVETVQFFDDTFFSRSTSDIHKFSAMYKEFIGLPFHAQCSPGTITEEKLDALVEAGLIYTEMGIQTGSKRIKRLYNRKESNREIIDAAKIIHKHRDKLLLPDYHVILDNPWETEDDTLDTLHLILDLPRPFCLKLSTLQFFPGTKLYLKGKEDGFFKNHIREIYRVPFLAPQNRYVDFLVYLTTFQWIPRKAFLILASPRLVRLLRRDSLRPVYQQAYILLEKLRLVSKGIGALMRGDFERIWRYFKRIK